MRGPRRERGFVLLAVLLATVLLSSLLLLAYTQVMLQWRTSIQVESRLHSQVLAANGIEYARSLLPKAEVDALLLGRDGSPCPIAGETRNPMPIAQARRIDPSRWRPDCDDGLPLIEGASLPPGLSDEGGGHSLIRFSAPSRRSESQEEDGVVLVRSMGIAPNRPAHPLLPRLRNTVTLVEAKLRQEKAFLVESPLTVFADTGLFEWQGDSFLIDGGERPPIAHSSSAQARLERDLRASLTETQSRRIIGGEAAEASFQDVRLDWLTSPQKRGFFQAEFWSHFLKRLPEFDQGLDGNLAFLVDAGFVELDFEGVLIARGDLILAGRSRVTGILIHLGQGRLDLQDQARVEGGVWIANPKVDGARLRAAPVFLRMADHAAIVYREEAVRRAVSRFPPTQLGWRIIFPEFNR